MMTLSSAAASAASAAAGDHVPRISSVAGTMGAAISSIIKKEKQEPESKPIIKQSTSSSVSGSGSDVKTSIGLTDGQGDVEDVRIGSPTPVTLPAIPDNWDPDKRRPLQCNYCNGRFLNPFLWKTHIETHEDQSLGQKNVPQFECLICPSRRFLYQESRANHYLLKHPDHFIPPARCSH